jgi:pimeloyl-ACP methyl ester carboxylesterase
MSCEPRIYRSAAGERIVMELYDRALARWPVPWQPLDVPTRHGRTFAIASGPIGAPLLLLLHGAASNAVSWVGDAGQYSRSLRVLAVDAPGDPGRSEQTRLPWQGSAPAEWLADILAAVGARSARIVALSQGAALALRFAAAAPERVARLALLAPAGIVPTRPSFLLRALLLSAVGRADALTRVVLGDEPLPAEALAFMEAIMTHHLARIEPEVLLTDQELRRLTMPVLMVAGARDALRSGKAAAARLQRLLPTVTTRILPGRGHALVNMAAEVLSFLEA